MSEISGTSTTASTSRIITCPPTTAPSSSRTALLIIIVVVVYFFFHLMMPSFYVIFKSSANLTFAQSKRSINWQENKPQHLLKVSIKYLKLYLKRTCYGHMAMLDMIDS
jgi:hypothetical protein